MATDLRHAAELLDRLLPQTTPAPWRDSSVDGNRYHALVAGTCIRRCDDYYAGPSGWDHPHEGYGGCLVAESMIATDRRLLAVMRNAADHLPGLLEALANEDPIEAGRRARALSEAIIDTHRPRADP